RKAQSAVTAEVDQAASDLLGIIELDEAGAKRLSSARADGCQVRADAGVNHHITLDRPRLLLSGDPVFLQLRPPPLAMLGYLAGIVRFGVIADDEVRAGGVPLASADGGSRRLVGGGRPTAACRF